MRCAYCNEETKGKKVWKGYSWRLANNVVVHIACKPAFDRWEKAVRKLAAASKGGKR